MKCIILRQPSKSFFKTSCDIEARLPEGEWRYFKFVSEDEVLGLYQNNAEGMDLHSDFFKYFLGQFNPEIENSFSVQQSKDFESFCKSLNTLLFENIQIFDLSVSDCWVWSNKKNEVLSVPKKLKAYLSF